MSGYARRPGVPPLARARSLVVPDASASFARRPRLPQLDCERPRGRDPDAPGPGPGPRPAFTCYVPGPALASAADAGFDYGKGKGLKPSPLGPLETHFGDGKLEGLEEANPFSFKEFLKTKTLGLLDEEPSGRPYAKGVSGHSLGLGLDPPASQTMGYGLEYQQSFFEDLTGAGDLLDEDDEDDEEDSWVGAYLPASLEQARPARAAASTSPRGEYVSFFSAPSELSAGPECLPSWTLGDPDSCVSPAGSPGDFAHRESLGDRHLRALQISYEALKEENSKLRRKLTEVQSFSETQTEMVRTLERKLEAKMAKEESDYHDLESVVQQVEQNLELMTKRAMKAENQVLKLKQEMSLLQIQVSNLKHDNEVLRSGEGASLTVVKQNTDTALQNLRLVMSNAHTSIKQLISGAEKLNLVAEILKSIDKISEIKEEENEEEEES
ncbi:endosome-associated-trafficking regulator 1 [Sorex araneus]|uniref:endosome-associated-trafficking regulator 1 n=1 Tax=Sorex araneus TaxID=42254 RepID=UPI002433B555|nr:endosome-associated-trafficking regulator 1 [Sorex araneus]